VDHTANLIPVKVSGIWRHGGERRRTDNGSFDRCWRYGNYEERKLFKVAEYVGGVIGHAVRYLRNRHNVDVGTDEVAIASRALVSLDPENERL
jgi:hypothetical protein